MWNNIQVNFTGLNLVMVVNNALSHTDLCNNDGEEKDNFQVITRLCLIVLLFSHHKA